MTGCTPQIQRVAMSQENRESIRKIDHQILVSQKSIKPTYTQGSYCYGIDPITMASCLIVDGVMLASVNAINHGKDESIKPLRAVVKENEFTGNLQVALNKEIKKSKLFKSNIPKVRVKNVDSKLLQEISDAEAKSDPGVAFLDIPIIYELSSNSDNLVIKALPEVKLKKDKLKTIYKNKIVYTTRLKEPSTKSALNIKKWADNNGQLIHRAFKDAANLIACHLINDMKIVDNKSILDGTKEKIITGGSVYNNAVVLSKNKDILVARNNIGEIIIDKPQIG